MANRTASELALALIVASLSACGGSNSTTASGGQPPPPASQKTINLYPVSSASGNRLYVMVTSVGSTAVKLPLIFDTGSAGLTLYAPAIFPSSMVNSGGFVFPSGETSISYGGITITNQQGTRSYGGTAGTTMLGNIGYTTVTFGDSSGALTTSMMPVLFYYSVIRTATGQPVSSVPQQGIFGVDSATNLITEAGSTQPADGYPPCSEQSTGTCRVVSVLKYLQYGQGTHAGFLLQPNPLQSCDITTAGSCTPQPMLTIGLTSSMEEGFSTVNLTCPPPGYVGPSTVGGYPVCLAAIPQATISVSGLATGTLTGQILFDSGTPFMAMRVPAGASFPAPIPDGSDVSIMTPSGFTYAYTAAPGIANTVVEINSTAPSIVGIAYFTTNSLFIDFDTSTEGWK